MEKPSPFDFYGTESWEMVDSILTTLLAFRSDLFVLGRFFFQHRVRRAFFERTRVQLLLSCAEVFLLDFKNQSHKADQTLPDRFENLNPAFGHCCHFYILFRFNKHDFCFFSER